MSTVAVEQALKAPVTERGSRLLAIAEDQWFDRKSARIAPRDLANDLIGMANADGGTIVVGLAESVVEGVDANVRRRNAQTQAAVDFILPPVAVKHRLVPCVSSAGSREHLLVFEVSTSNVVHASTKDVVYLRVGDETRRLSFHQRQELLFDKGQASYEARALKGVGLDVLDQELLEKYAAAVGHPDAIRLLRARGLATRGNELTIAGLLLFASEPQAALPETFVRVLRYRGRQRGTGAGQQLVEDITIEGPIPLQLLEARSAIGRLQPVRRALISSSGRFGDIPLIPEDAWLEGVVNAVVHRSYSLAGDHIRVEIFDDRIEVSSPGRFPGLVDLSDPLRGTRFARNPRIARVCSDLHFGQELGEGIRRIFEEVRAAGLVDPVYSQTAASVVLTLSAEPADRALDARLPAEARTITAALRRAERLSTGEISEILELSRPATIMRLDALREEGLIEWVGKSPTDPRAYWQLSRA
ncbi:MAG TPA: ATP-binding protein [Solirubrobacteraceae bacterium]|jgi:ATP-dependent DNA helicase RecG|nr:ATP-binding protein [Solirubrobacteraceae bacterium]